MDLLAAHRRALATAFPGREPPDSVRDAAPAPRGNAARARVNAAADQQLMTLLRRLTAIASQSGRARSPSLLAGQHAPAPRGGGGRPAGYASSRYAGGGSVSGADRAPPCRRAAASAAILARRRAGAATAAAAASTATA